MIKHSVPSLGAINKTTKKYVSPRAANKKDKYICADCNKDVMLCQGQIKAHHFRHFTNKTEIACHYYDRPNESQIHKDAKLLMKMLLLDQDAKNGICLTRQCVTCPIIEMFDIPLINPKKSKIVLEHRFEYNGRSKIADVAYLDKTEIVSIFEICHKHKTRCEDRPEPWFEIDARTLVEVANQNKWNNEIPCIRCEKCEDCKLKEFILHEKRQNAEQKIISWLNELIQSPKMREIYVSGNISIGNHFDGISILYTNNGSVNIHLVDYYVKQHNHYLNSDELRFNINWILYQTKAPEQLEKIIQEIKQNIEFDMMQEFIIIQNQKKTREMQAMSNEDERSIQRLHEQHLKKELMLKKLEEERCEKIKQERLFEKIKQERLFEIIKQNEIMEREKVNIRCGICNINYCKCDKPIFGKNEYNKKICNFCKKYKCMCVRITDYFKK